MKYTEEVLRDCAARAFSIREVIRLATGNDKPGGGTQNHVGALLKKYDIDTSHFLGQGHRKGQRFPEEGRGPEFYFKRLAAGSPKIKSKYLRRALIDSGVSEICAECGLWPEWNHKPLTLQVDHIDGDWYNNTRENLRFLCPNCHCQTETWGRTKRL